MKKDVILSFISWLLMLSLAIAGLSVISWEVGREFPGDGYEYLMMPVSIMNHGTTDVTSEDIDDAKAYYGNEIFDTIYRDREDITLVRGSDGKDYAKHVGFYSVLCMPMRALFHFLGMNPAKAFLYMNLVFWLTACLMVQLVLKTDQLKKTLLMVFLVINPAGFYLTWIHTEILMFSLVVASLVMRHNKNYVVSMLLMSLAAVSNLTLLVPAFLLGIDFLVTAYRESGRKLKGTIISTIPVLVAAIPGFVPIIRSFILFGSYSPVAAVASTSASTDPVDSRLICALSYIFDPNQGMIVYTLLIVPAFFIAVVVNVIKRKNVFRSVLYLLAVIAMLFIVSQELHINCGMSYIMRYNVWMLPFMAFYNVFNISPKLSSCVFGISGAWTLAILMLFGLMFPKNLYLDYTLFGRFVMDNMPSLYNPPVGIFYSRTLTEENYYCEYPVPYFDEEGNLRKLLITPEAATLLDEGEWTIYGPGLETVDFRSLNSTSINGEPFTYVNIPEDGYHIVRDVDTLDFSELTQNDMSLIRSPMGFEGDVGLVYGNSLNLRLHMLPGTYTGRFGLVNVFGGVQNITVRVNGAVVFDGPVSMDDDSFEFEFTLDDSFRCDMDIDIPGALSPISVLPDTADDRVLSLYLTDFTYTRAD
ncbi:MAG: hypothetical protein IJ757_03855 [Clostridiales bacterium]|nr:hypothetical protein [Clostridiales bacterium]